ncbi:hypothetical protein CPB83DRAFT_398378 [Crepidotus variabilis]|uniref:F-box domain-containing protein n=1 Tax=Crepidotus variabilis TaxID=179855 RepID=A0A9P6EEM0_9AGAR|nr:hypothetical protein CPB83DRAFT_398378 [Crepidotus variabilis]
MSSLQELPTELLEKILGNLGLEDLLACQLINPFFNDTIRNSVDLNYQLLLQRSGNLDNPHCRATILQKRNTLDNAEFLWSSRSFIPQKLFGEIRLTNHFRLTKLLGFTDRCLIYGAREADKDESITTHLIYTLNSSNIDNYHQNNGIGKEGKDWILPPPPHLQGSRVLGLATDIDENGVVISIHA